MSSAETHGGRIPRAPHLPHTIVQGIEVLALLAVGAWGGILYERSTHDKSQVPAVPNGLACPPSQQPGEIIPIPPVPVPTHVEYQG
jgi:hypothetical protein